MQIRHDDTARHGRATRVRTARPDGAGRLLPRNHRHAVTAMLEAPAAPGAKTPTGDTSGIGGAG